MVCLYRVDCSACPFSCCTNSPYEAGRIRQFHDNWNSDERQANGQRLHVVRITASTFALPLNQAQAHLEDLAEVPA